MATEIKKMISIIFIHYSQNKERNELAKTSLASLQSSISHLPCELIVVDNGGDYEMSKFFLEQTEQKKITHYIRNADNIWFGRARNQALEISEGEFISVVDNDLIYEKGWLEKCIEALKGTDKLLATPMPILSCHKKYSREENGLKINTFAGSNCWVMKRTDWLEIKGFEDHPLAGTLWCRKYAKMGYGVIVIENLVKDMGDQKTQTFGYKKFLLQKNIQLHQVVIKKTLLNGEEVSYFKYEN